jgi:hypothetical protein
MKAIGFRPEKDAVQWAIVSGTLRAPVLVAFGKLSPPEEYGECESLGWFRDEVETLLHQYSPERGAVHLMSSDLETKPTSRGLEKMFWRARIEGVLLEVCQSWSFDVLAKPRETIGDGRRMKPKKSSFVSVEGHRIDWREMRSWCLRQASTAAAALLDAEDEPK